MKAFALSVLLAISSFFGIKNKSQVVLVEPIPTVIQNQTIVPTEVVEIPTQIVTPTIRVIPTTIAPKSSINEDILKKFFGVSDIDSVNQVLNNKSQLQKYEQEFYQKFLTSPIPRVTISSNTQLIAMPGMNGMVICTGSQLKKLYEEIGPIESQIYFEKMDYDCHHNPKVQETKECQDWRKINDANRVQPTKGSIDDEISALQKKINEYANKKNVYDDLLVKYCPKK
ncbi:MAG: hypothetical protein WCV93_00340 [Candidatus Shapirobacteria bacterium]|jgi:hypothetical protein